MPIPIARYVEREIDPVFNSGNNYRRIRWQPYVPAMLLFAAKRSSGIECGRQVRHDTVAVSCRRGDGTYTWREARRGGRSDAGRP